MHIALVTAKHVDPARTDDALLCAALVEQGDSFEWLPWDRDGVRWQQYDRVVLRSCWDYHRELPRFAAWLESLAELGAALVNPLPVVWENLHKAYLLKLAAAGVPVPPLKLLARGSHGELTRLQAELGAELIVKPAVSGSAWRTFRVPAGGAAHAQAEFAALVAERDAIVQAFVPEIQTRGEYSLMFFAGRYSHAVLKTPAAGEFRCQGEYGGSVTALDPPAAVRAAAERALAVFGAPPYARLDIVVSRGLPLVMEVELIEPVLFFAAAPGSAALMVDALAA